MKKSYFRWHADQLMRSCAYTFHLVPCLGMPFNYQHGVYTFRNRSGQLVTLEV